MNDTIKLLAIANRTASQDASFIAYFLNKYIEIERTTREVLMQTLNCTLEQFYRLGLCKAPDVNLPDYLPRLNNVSNYVGISAIELNKVLKRVNSVVQLSNTSNNDMSYLIAARDKKKKDN